MSFNWGKWLEGAIASGFVALIASLGPMLADGDLTKAEIYMLASFFVGGIALYCKSHPPVE